jgi:hypothetical protein
MDNTKEELTWKDVLNTSKFKPGFDIHDLLPILLDTGYEYFSWNGCIYHFSYGYILNDPVRWENGQILTVMDLE